MDAGGHLKETNYFRNRILHFKKPSKKPVFSQVKLESVSMQVNECLMD